MEWETVGSVGDIVSWARTPEGTTFTGVFAGKRKGRFGELVDLVSVEERDGGDVTLDAPIALANRLADYPENTPVRITFLGKKLSEKSGKRYNDFHVQRPKPPKAQRTALPATAEQSEAVPF